MIFHERKTDEYSILYEINKSNPEYAILFGARLFDGKPAIEKIHDELIHNPHLENILIIGDPGVGKTVFKSQLTKYLQEGPYRHLTPFRFIDLSYDPYSKVYTEGNEGVEEKKILRQMMNEKILEDFIVLQHEASWHQQQGLRTGQMIRTFKIIEMPVTGRVDRGKTLAQYLANEVSMSGLRKTIVIALVSTPAVFDVAGESRSIITQEKDGYKMQRDLRNIGVVIPNFKPDDKKYLDKLKSKVIAMAREEQIIKVRGETTSEARQVISKMSPTRLATLVEKMAVLRQLGETDQVVVKQHLTYIHQLLHSDELYLIGYGLGLPKDAAICVVNEKVATAFYDVLGELAA